MGWNLEIPRPWSVLGAIWAIERPSSLCATIAGPMARDEECAVD